LGHWWYFRCNYSLRRERGLWMACGERGLGVCLYSPAGDVEGGANRAVAFGGTD
jgi:hypothetical protein